MVPARMACAYSNARARGIKGRLKVGYSVVRNLQLNLLGKWMGKRAHSCLSTRPRSVHIDRTTGRVGQLRVKKARARKALYSASLATLSLLV